ncbi:MAG: vWA domain-containing protein [Phycisphaerales bacterium]
MVCHNSVTRQSKPFARRVVAMCALAGVLALSAGKAPACPPDDPVAKDAPARVPTISIALLLDTSNSMDGLIGQAKAQLWNVVNRFRSCKRDGMKDGVAPVLRIALYQYGNSKLPQSSGYIEMVSPFTTDLDSLSEKLFGLQTEGGNEYCGAVIGRAAKELAWGECPGDLNLIFIAGNEPFTQGDVPYAESIADGVRKKIRINTIHCGTYQEGVDGKWRDGATLGRGNYNVIDQSEDVRHIVTPYDDEISSLGVEVNTTYLAYGRDGEESQVRQQEMDTKTKSGLPAPAAAGATVQRSIAKNSANYRNAHWDLVDAIKDGKVKLEELKQEDAPKELRGLTIVEQSKKVEEMRTRRVEINKRVAELNIQRETFLREQRKAGGKDTTLGAALLEAIDKQAKEEGWTLGE